MRLLSELRGPAVPGGSGAHTTGEPAAWANSEKLWHVYDIWHKMLYILLSISLLFDASPNMFLYQKISEMLSVVLYF